MLINDACPALAEKKKKTRWTRAVSLWHRSWRCTSKEFLPPRKCVVWFLRWLGTVRGWSGTKKWKSSRHYRACKRACKRAKKDCIKEESEAQHVCGFARNQQIATSVKTTNPKPFFCRMPKSKILSVGRCQKHKDKTFWKSYRGTAFVPLPQALRNSPQD